MKKLLFATLCSAMFFGACSNEDSPIAEGPQLADNQFLLKLNSQGLDLVQNRSSAALGNEKLFKTTTVYLYDNTGKKLASKTVADLFNGNVSEKVTIDLGTASNTSVEDVVVLSNMQPNSTDDPFYLLGSNMEELGTVRDNASLMTNLDALGWVNNTSSNTALPFAGSGKATNGTATVSLQRKVARIDIRNEAGGAAEVYISDLALNYDDFLTPNENFSTNTTPNKENLELAVIGDSQTNSVYVLPTSDNITIKASVGSKSGSMSFTVKPNKKYLYTIKPATTDINSVQVTLDAVTDWDSFGGSEGEVLPSTLSQDASNTPLSASLSSSPIVLEHIAADTDLATLSAIARNFTVSFAYETVTTRTGENLKVVAHVAPKKYTVKELVEVISILQTTDGVPSEMQTLKVVQEPFVFNEIQMGSSIFMDRDLGAKSTEEHGEIYFPGYGFVDQTASSNTHKSNFIGGSRVAEANLSTATLQKTTFFAEDPCPKGWHTMDADEAALIFNYGTGTGGTHGVINGNYDFNNSESASIGILGLTPSLEISESKHTKLKLAGSAAELTFNLQHGHYSGSWYNPTNNFSSGWWVNHIHDNNLYVSATFSPNLNSTQRIQCRPSTINTFGGKRALSIRCVKNEKVQAPN